MNIKWIPIDKDDLYEKEILAINTSHDMLVGYLEAIKGDKSHVYCTDRQPGNLELFHATHYIPVTELVKLLKLQAGGPTNVSITKPCEHHPLDRVIYRGDDKFPLCSKCGHEIRLIPY